LDASLIISVYNKVEYLELVLAGLERQSTKNIEIIIADDGSEDKMERFIEQYKRNTNLSVKHVRQEKIGFRKNRILNEAVKCASADYLIFIDGDCVPHKHFIKAHINGRDNHAVLCGSRVMLSERLTQQIGKDEILSGKLENLSLKLIYDVIKGKASRLEEGLYFDSDLLRKIKNKRKTNILGSNFSIPRTLLEGINGFDEDYIGPGLGEDSDIQYRLEISGVRLKSVRNYAILYHLYHPKTVESIENQKLFNQKIKLNQMICKNGLAKI
jgi:glycosyltransferase involved in cell wall biosynthesis